MLIADPSNRLQEFVLITSLVGDYGMTEYYSCGLVRQNVAVLFQEVEILIKHFDILRSLTASDF
jgi:hypothetical protein